MLGFVKSNGEDDFLYFVINGTNVCESLDSKINNHNLPENHGLLFSEFIWDTVTNLDLFKRLIQDDNSERSLINRRIQLRDVYLSNLNLKNWDINISRTLIRPERKFIEELKSGAIEYFDMFRMCYKDIINESKEPEETIRGIIKLHTCFVPNGISRNLPLPVFKMCKGLGFNFVKCFGTKGMKYIVDEANRKLDQVSKAECFIPIYNITNITYTTTEDYNTAETTTEINSLYDTTNNNNESYIDNTTFNYLNYAIGNEPTNTNLFKNDVSTETEFFEYSTQITTEMDDIYKATTDKNIKQSSNNMNITGNTMDYDFIYKFTNYSSGSETTRNFNSKLDITTEYYLSTDIATNCMTRENIKSNNETEATIENKMITEVYTDFNMIETTTEYKKNPESTIIKNVLNETTTESNNEFFDQATEESLINTETNTNQNNITDYTKYFNIITDITIEYNNNITETTTDFKEFIVSNADYNLFSDATISSNSVIKSTTDFDIPTDTTTDFNGIKRDNVESTIKTEKNYDFNTIIDSITGHQYISTMPIGFNEIIDTTTDSNTFTESTTNYNNNYDASENYIISDNIKSERLTMLEIANTNSFENRGFDKTVLFIFFSFILIVLGIWRYKKRCNRRYRQYSLV
ncbi:putative SP-containing membrane protein [Vairimorpha necatrix]|uniref:SP-containing membrane protein n=1 Tax=Vairimorpha necatrix TaxID=6039 RepID=A0AAX4JCA9_9MICR